MARQAQLAQLEEVVPKTLPDDFDLWDGGEAPPPATLPKDFDDFDEPPAPQVKSSAPRVVVAAPASGNAVEMPVNRMSAASQVHTMPAPAQIAPPKPKPTQKFPIKRGPASITEPVGGKTLTIHEITAEAPAAPAQPAKYVTTEELSTLVEAYNATLDEEFDGERQRKKNLLIRWVGAIVLLLAIVATMFVLMRRKPAEQSRSVVVVQHPIVTSTPDATPLKEKPSPSKPTQHTTETSAPAQHP